MQAAVVNFFDAEKGWGFATLESGESVFVHRSAIDGEGYRVLVQGEPIDVECEWDAEKNRFRATKATMPAHRQCGLVADFEFKKGYGWITPEGSSDRIFFHFSELLQSGRGKASAEPGDRVEFEIGDGPKGPQAVKVKVADGRRPLFRFAYLGPEEQWLDQLAAKAEPEDWNFRHDANNRGRHMPILKGYLTYTFARLEDENKVAFGAEGSREFACFNTGLVTPKQEAIFALFVEKSPALDGCRWKLSGFHGESEHAMLGKFQSLPELANYFDEPGVLLYDRRLDLYIDVDHIVDDNIHRFPEEVRGNKYLAQQTLEAARRLTEQRVYRNYKTAIPQFHRGSVQLLLPLCLIQPDRADLALTVSKVGNQYRGDTVLTLDMAYSNARLLCRPDTEWLTP